MAAIVCNLYQIDRRRIADAVYVLMLGLGALPHCRNNKRGKGYHDAASGLEFHWFGDADRGMDGQPGGRARLGRGADQTAAYFRSFLVLGANVEAWTMTVGLMVVALAIRGGRDDPQRPYWSAAAILADSAMMGGLALWLRKPSYASSSGLLLNVAGALVWLASMPRDWSSLILINVGCFAAASIVWSLLSFLLGPLSPGRGKARPPAFEHETANSACGCWPPWSAGRWRRRSSASLTRCRFLWRTAWALVLAALVLFLVGLRGPLQLGGLYILGLAAPGWRSRPAPWLPRAVAWHARAGPGGHTCSSPLPVGAFIARASAACQPPVGEARRWSRPPAGCRESQKVYRQG